MNLRVISGTPSALFVYGSLLPDQKNSARLRGLRGTWLSARIRGRLLRFVRGENRGYTVLEPDKVGGNWIPGAVLISRYLPAHWNRLDRFEGRGYRRVTLDAVLSNHRRLPVQCYIVSRDRRGTFLCSALNGLQ